MKSYLINFEPQGRDYCLCGSGKRFKNCCKNIYKEKKFDGTNLFNKGEYKKALTSTRAHITWYRLCHKAHTEHFLESGKKEALELLDIDVKAMSSLFGLLLSCYDKCGIIDDFLNIFTFYENAIKSESWKLKLDYHKAFYFYIYRDEQESARRILNNYNIKKINEVDVLTIYLDIESEILNQVEIIELSERISRLTDLPSTKLQYSVTAGVQYCLLNDIKTGIKRISKAIEEYESLPEEERTLIGRHHLASSYKIVGELINNKECIDKSVEILINELDSEEYSKLGKSQLLFDLAECYFHLDDYRMAISTYDRSLETLYSELTLVFKARALIKAEDISKARELIGKVDTFNFSKANMFDFAIAKCELAIASKSPSDISGGLEEIKSIKTNDPLFQNIIKDLIIQLYDVKSNTNKLKETLKKLNRYISLKPNLFGFGLDINAIIDDIVQ